MSESLTIQDVLRQYEPEAKKLEAFYRNAQIIGVSTKRGFPGLEGSEVARHIFKSNGDSLRVDEIVLETSRYPPPRWVEWITVANPAGSFEVSRASGQSSYVLRDHGSDGARMDTVIRWKYRLSSAPYQYRDYTIIEFLKMPQLAILGCELIERTGQSLVKVSYQFPGTTPGWFLFAVDKHWALIENAVGNDERLDRLIVHYDDRSGMPVMSKIESWREAPGGATSMREEIVIEEFHSLPAALSEFQLASVGLPEPGGQIRRRWLLGLTILGIVCLIAIRILQGIRKSSEQ